MAASFSIATTTPNALWAFDKKKLGRVFRQAGGEIMNAAKAAIRASGGGRTYYKGKKGKYQASLAGNAPAKLSGALIRSMSVKALPSGLGATIRASEFYAKMLEGGAQGGVSHGGGAPPVTGKTRRGQRNIYNKRKRLAVVGTRVLKPRPFLSTASEARQASLRARIIAAVEDGVTFKKQKP